MPSYNETNHENDKRETPLFKESNLKNNNTA